MNIEHYKTVVGPTLYYIVNFELVVNFIAVAMAFLSCCFFCQSRDIYSFF